MLALHKNLKNRLLDGSEFTLTTADGDRDARIWFDDSPSWRGGFKIWFNGELIHSSKTFVSFEKRLQTLINKWELQ